MDIMTDVLYQVSFPIVGVKWWPCESVRHWGPFNVVQNGDRAALRKVRLIASIAALWGHHSSRKFEPQSGYSNECERSLCRHDS